MFIRSTLHGKVGLIELCRTGTLNVLSKEVVSELIKELGKADSDPSIGAIVLTGNEKSFAGL